MIGLSDDDTAPRGAQLSGQIEIAGGEGAARHEHLTRGMLPRRRTRHGAIAAFIVSIAVSSFRSLESSSDGQQ